MQKRVVYNFNAQPATETATGHANGKAVKASNAIGKIKRAFYGKGLKLAVFVVLLFASLFCAIGSADWIISQQKDVPSEKDGTKTFNVDDFGLDKYIIVPPNSTYNGNPVCAEVKDRVDGDARELPTEAKGNVKYKVIPYNKPSAQSRLLRAPQNAASTERNKAPAANAVTSLPNEDDFKDIGYTTELPTNAGTYAVLITSVVDGVSYGKAIKVFTIAPCPVKIEWSGAVDFTYDGADHLKSINATAKTTDGATIDGIVTKSFTYKAQGATTSTKVTEVKNAGTYTATAEITNPNYALAEGSNATKDFTILQKELTVTADNKTIIYGESAPDYTTTYEGLLDCDIGKLGTPGFTCDYPTKNHDAGTYDINVSGLENSNYNISYVKGTLTVTQRTVTIAWETKNSFVYNGNAQTRDYTAENVVTGDKLGLTVTVTGENITGSSAINAGTYTATAQITNPNYVLDVSSKTATFTITPRTVTVTAEDKTVTYGDPVPDYTATYEGLLDCDKGKLGTPDFTCAYTTTSPVGTYPITVSGLANSNYTINYKSGTLTVKPGTIIVSVTGKTISYGDPVPTSYDLTCNNPDISISDLGTPVFKCGYTTKSPVGEYPITVTGLKLENYIIEYATGAKLIVRQREVTVSWSNTTFTYNGKGQKPVPSFNNVVNNDDLKATVSVNKESTIVDKYTATATISNDNYKLSGKTDVEFKIIPLKIAFDGIIERDYAKGGIKLDGKLFEGKFKIAETIEDSSLVDLSSVLADINGGTANNFSDAENTSKPENGFYSYTFGKNILAGSTYLISGITLKSTSNFELTTDSIYLKYKTAKIEKTAENKTEFFTIEDALAAGGDITLCGNIDTSSASPNSSYVITAFSKLSLSAGNGDKFKDYKSNYNYTLSGKKLIVSFDGSAKEEDVQSSYKEAGDVFSALVISNGITITLSSSASMIAAAEVGFDYSICTTLAKNHGVIMNNGKIVVNSGCSVTAYGYIKGNGLIQMNSGATALDALTIYDWPGGDAAKDMYKTVFPTNAYTVHNISCPTKVFSGAIYSARVYLNALSGVAELNETVIIIGTQEKKGMFNADSDSSASDYILKSVITNQKDIETAKDINSNIALSNQRATKGTVTTLNHRDNIEIYGKYSDAPTEISKTVLFITIALKTSTSIPLPVGFMDITVRNNSTLTLNSSDYLILPGAKLTVDNGGTLTLGNNVDLVALPYASAPTSGNYRYTRFYTANTDGNGKKDGKLIVNGTLSGSGYSLGGNISTEQAGATLNVVNASGSYVTMRGSSKPYYDSGTINAFGDIMNSSSTAEETHFGTGTYYSTKIGSAYAWFKNSATITYNPKGGTLNGTSGNTTETVTLPSGGYTDLPTPNRDYYEFGGWYFNPDLTQKATAIYTTCTLYAKWTPIQYTIKYILPYAECGTLANGSLSGNQEKELVSPPNKTIIVEGTTYVFLGWYLKSDYSGNSVTSVSAANADNSGIINVYAYYAGNSYSVEYEENPGNITFANGKTVKKPETQNFSQGVEIPLASLRSLSSYDRDENFDYYFAGWYLSTDSNETIITSLPNTIDGDIILCAKWIKKYTVNITFTSNDTILETENKLGTIVKYYKDDEVNLQSLYDKFSIATKIDEYYAPHGNIKEYTFIEWQENGTTITSGIKVNRDFDISAYHKRCYYITVQKSPNQTVNGVTGGLGTFYVSPSDTTYATAVTCMLIANKERYTPKYSATNASVDANGVISFANSNSAEDVIINVTTQRWFMVDNQYTDKITLKLDSSTGTQDGNWFTENSKVTVTISGRSVPWGYEKATIQKNGIEIAVLEQKYRKSADYTITSLDGYYTISKK